MEVDAENPAQDTEGFEAAVDDNVDVGGAPCAVGHHDGFAVGRGEGVPEIAGFEQIDVDAAGDGFDAFGEDFVVKIGFASGAVEEDGEEQRQVGEAGVQDAAIFFGEDAMDGGWLRSNVQGGGVLAAMAIAKPDDEEDERDDIESAGSGEKAEIGEAEDGNDQEPEEMAEVLAGAAVFVDALEAAPCLGPGGGSKHHQPIRLFKEKCKQGVHGDRFDFRRSAQGFLRNTAILPGGVVVRLRTGFVDSGQR